MTQDDELDDRLRRMFSDDGLILPVAQDAERTVVAGARRRRRRRLSAAAAGGMVAVAGLVFAAAALVGAGNVGNGVQAASASRPPGPSLTLTAPAEPTSTRPPTSTDVLGPYGADGVWLGMPARLAVRLAVGKSPSAEYQDLQGCSGYAVFVPASVPATPYAPATTTESPSGAYAGKPGVITVVVSPRRGVVELGGVTSLRTPEGVHLGMSAKFVVTTYSKVDQPAKVSSVMLAPVPGNSQASYVFNVDNLGIVRAMWLRAEGDPDCK